MTSMTPAYSLPRRQPAFWCRICAASGKLIRGYCSRCYARQGWDRRYFAGLRARVLDRDGHACQLCTRTASGKRSIVVHHRRPGWSKIAYLISLCPACHARLHRTLLWRQHSSRSPLHAMLWRELHPGAPEQLALFFEDACIRPAALAAKTGELRLG